jgi:hypothetical protein
VAFDVWKEIETATANTPFRFAVILDPATLGVVKLARLLVVHCVI